MPGRKDDQFGIAYGLARISGRLVALDRDRAFFTGMPFPIRSSERIIEVTYLWQVTRSTKILNAVADRLIVKDRLDLEKEKLRFSS